MIAVGHHGDVISVGAATGKVGGAALGVAAYLDGPHLVRRRAVTTVRVMRLLVITVVGRPIGVPAISVATATVADRITGTGFGGGGAPDQNGGSSDD